MFLKLNPLMPNLLQIKTLYGGQLALYILTAYFLWRTLPSSFAGLWRLQTLWAAAEYFYSWWKKNTPQQRVVVRTYLLAVSFCCCLGSSSCLDIIYLKVRASLFLYASLKRTAVYQSAGNSVNCSGSAITYCLQAVSSEQGEK